MNFFIEQLPTDNSHARNALLANKVKDYEEVLRTLIGRTQSSGSCNIAREELRTMFDFTVGGMPTSPNKFSSLLKHHRIHMEVVWIDNKSVRGMKVFWKDTTMFDGYLTQHLTSPMTQVPAAPKLRVIGATPTSKTKSRKSA